MDLNSILKTGGKVDVLIRAKTPQQIGPYQLEKNEPYTLIENIAINFVNSQEGNINKVDGVLVNNNNSIPYMIQLFNVPFSEKICNLVFNNKKELKKSYYCILTAENHKLILHHQIAYNVFVYDMNNNKIGTSMVVTDGFIASDLLENNKQYFVIYQYIITDANTKMYDLKSPDRAYFSLDIFAKGNKDNNSSDVFIKVDTCSLITNSQLYFNEGLNDINLSFYVIKQSDDNNDNYIIIE